MVSRPGIEWSASATPWIAALAVLCSSTALAGVIEGGLWLVHIAVAIAVVTGTGALLRSTRLPAPLVGLGQILALLCLLVTIFTRSGFLAVLPGPTSLGDLLTVLGDSISQVQTGVPPVEATPAIRCLVMVAIGLVTVLVDTLAVAAAAPAASGLVLLCVFAVPASLAEEMLPFWTFIFGAAAFALLLAVDGQHRHEAWRGRLGTGASSGSGSSATTVAAIAMVIALIVGAGFTVVGTIGRLPGSGDGIGGSGSSGLGINAMTSLRGMLNQGRTRELFHVRGMPVGAETYLRATTLDRYVPNKGWERGGDPSGSPVQGSDLPRPPGDRGEGRTTRIDIDPVGWRDFWLPIYGSPRRIETPDDQYLYDPGRGIVFAQNQRKPDPYQLETVLDTPTADQLRRASGEPVDRTYNVADGVEERVNQLARDITKDATNQFDKAVKLYEHFTSPTSEFEYKLETKGDLTSDALSSFLFEGKVGYCEQYASAMAVMARKVGIPARVALGFTAGYVDGDHRVLTSEDAHAWVEIFFPGHGWVMFDPTPTNDGRAIVPEYLKNNSPAEEPIPSGSTSATTTTAPPSTSAAAGTTDNTQGGDDQSSVEAPIPAWHFWSLGSVLLMAVLLTLLMVLRAGMAGASWARRLLLPITVALWALAVALSAALLSWLLAILLVVVGLTVAPLTIRGVRRHNRLHTVAGLGPQAASAAWEELMAESIDRGVLPPASETVRAASRRLAREHNLDDTGRDGLRTLISSIERSWYSAHPEADAGLPAAVQAVRASIARTAPLSLRARLFPRSVLHPVPRPTMDAPAPIPV